MRRSGEKPVVCQHHQKGLGNPSCTCLEQYSETIQSTICVPLLGLDGKAFGIISLDSLDRRRQFSSDDLQLFVAVANEASHAFENARLLTIYMEKLRQDCDMTVSARVQRALIPETMPRPGGYGFYGSCDAAGEVGGDYDDCFNLPDLQSFTGSQPQKDDITMLAFGRIS